MITPARCEKCGVYPPASKGHELFEGMCLCPKCLQIERNRFLSLEKIAPFRICKRLSLMKEPGKEQICEAVKKR